MHLAEIGLTPLQAIFYSTMRLPSTNLTLFGRSFLLLISEYARFPPSTPFSIVQNQYTESRIMANVVCWIVAGILFGRNRATAPVLSLALLAWVCATISQNIVVT